jgi:PAS domain-containing protein
MAVSWHFFGGLQQPLFPLFIVLPLLPAALVLDFWQRQWACGALFAVLASGVALSPDTNSFIEARYGLSVTAWRDLPAWLPRSAVAFPDVSTSPSYELVMVISIGVMGVALSNMARALVNLSRRSADEVLALEHKLEDLQHQNADLIVHSPSAVMLVATESGRILLASERLERGFDIPGAAGRFLLDSLRFAYPAVIRRLLATGGEEVQSATVRGQEVVLRIRAELFGPPDARCASLSLEPCDEICWRGALDALSEPVFVINTQGRIAFLNRTAVQILGAQAQGASADALLCAGGHRWWDVAPLEAARRMLEWQGQRYLASIRRERVSAGIGELSVVRLTERAASLSAA